ncbi:MAG TPA: hypothetical protein VMB22_04505, partial [Verrucomicrobiae bacterium]|nr:hypothetical protein [Verrucomicrobiae bacterium]
NWSSVLNWTNVTSGGNGPPGPANNLEFTNISTVGSPATTNNIVDAGFTVGSILYNNNAANTSPNYHVTAFNSGQTLMVTNGIAVGTAADSGAAQTVNATITGANGTLILSNGVVAVTQGSGTDGAHQAVLDLSGLGTLNLTNVSRLAIAVAGVPPQNGNGQQRCSGIIYLAQTNSIAVTSTGMTNGILVGWNDSQGNSGAGDKGSALYLGQANSLFTDAIYVGSEKTLGCLLAFDPNGLNNPTAIIRGVGGANSRVSFWGIGDTSTKNGSNQSASGTNDFTGGSVDAMVNDMNIGVTVTGAGSGANSGNGTGTLTFNAGTIDVNNLTNGWSVGTGTTAGSDIGTGTVNVNGSATLNVNNILVMAQNTGTGTGVPAGTLNINGGTVEVTNILGGGGTAKINLNSGMLNLQGGQITNVTTLNIGDGISSSAQLVNGSLVHSPNAITVATNGALIGDTFVLTPNLIVNGTVSPGDVAVGAITNTGNITFGAGGIYLFDMEDAIGQAGSNWDSLTAGGGLNIQATNTNPFTIELRSIDDNLNDNNPGAADFGYDSAQSWPIASGSGITNFVTSDFIVDDSQFQNDLAGGYFVVQTNANSLLLAFVPNNPPNANDSWFYLPPGGILQIPISALASQWSDPDGDPVQFAGVNPNSANGTNNVSSDGTYIYYTNLNNSADAIIYTVADVRTNPPAVYRPGDTVQTDTATIHLLPPPAIASLKLSGGDLTLGGTGGIADQIYYVLSSTSLALPLNQWQPIATNNFDNNGNFTFTNTVNPGAPQQFYILSQ